MGDTYLVSKTISFSFFSFTTVVRSSIFFMQAMVWWTNVRTGPTTVTVTLHATTLQPLSFVNVTQTSTELENRDNVTVSVNEVNANILVQQNEPIP